MRKLNRRDFFKFAGGATLSSFLVPDELLANNGKDFNDFKVLVVVDMMGGNDALNMFVPADSRSGITTGYESYAKNRTSVTKVKDRDLMGELRAKIDSNGALAFGGAQDNPYYDGGSIKNAYTKGFYLLDKENFDSKVGINPLMPELAYWLDRGKGAVVQNVGVLVEPATKSELKSKQKKHPPFIFAHDAQNILMKTGQASSVTVPTGWLGRLADEWQGLNGGSGVYKMNINLSPFGRFRMFFGNKTVPMTIGVHGPSKYSNLNLNLHRNLASLSLSEGIFPALYGKLKGNIMNQVQETVEDWKGVSGSNDIFSGLTDVYGLPFYNKGKLRMPEKELGFGVGNGLRGAQVEYFTTAARLIEIGKRKGFKRMVIAIAVGGYDNHAYQTETHGKAIRAVSMGIDRFMKSMETLGLSESVTLFTVSEFARSASSNKDGTDHAWGGAYTVLGGSVKPGNYGEFPDLTLKGEQDYGNRGLFIPTASFTQYYATLLKWFGADAKTLKAALPELDNFSVKDLGFMKS
jgi:uncharacterized protein (DUF1501 family)